VSMRMIITMIIIITYCWLASPPFNLIIVVLGRFFPTTSFVELL